jgi:Intracellular proteinase inhibitor
MVWNAIWESDFHAMIPSALMLSGLLLGDSISFQVVVPDSVPVGEPVLIVLRLTNRTDRPLTLYLQGRPIAFDITVRAGDGSIVWRRLEGEVVSAILAVQTLEPGATLEFTEHWRQVSNRGVPIRPGEYTVTGALPTDKPQPLVSEPTSFRITPRSRRPA